MATPILSPDAQQASQAPPLLTLDQLRVIPGLTALRILNWAQAGLPVGELAARIRNGTQCKAALEPLLTHELITKVGKRPDWMYVANVRLPRVREGSTVADYLADPDPVWGDLATMIGVALGAPVDSTQGFARAIGLDRDSVRPYMAGARMFHRSLFELKGIEAAVAHSNGGVEITSSSQPEATAKGVGLPSEGVEITSSSSCLSPATAVVTPFKGVNQPAVPSTEPDHPPDPPSDPDFALRAQGPPGRRCG